MKSAGLAPTIHGKAHLYESRDAFLLLYSAPDGRQYDLEQERARLAHHQANNEAIKEMTARGNLVPADLVVKNGGAMVGAARAKLLAVPSKIRAKNPGLSTATIASIQGTIEEALDELASDGIPQDVRKHIREYLVRVETATSLDDQSMGE